MSATTVKTPGLTGNQLKILALITMTCDHVGIQLLPQFPILRILGRLSMPIFAYMIAEGCRYTHDRKRYLLRLVLLAALCQAVYFVAMRSLYMCILVTFSLSVSLIYALDNRVRRQTPAASAIFWGTLALVAVVCQLLPDLIPGFGIDYGLIGVLLPVVIYFEPRRNQRLLIFTLGLILLSLDLGGNQWISLAAVPLLALYNGQRGKYHIGTFFYLYYPLHLAVIYLISLLL